MQQFKTKIVSNTKIAPGHYELSFKTRALREKTKPGQFFNIKIGNPREALLRRPFSAHKIYKERTEILYKVVGKATKILSAKKKGDILDVIGPLGNGFNLPAIRYPLSVILIAGGHGVAPLVALARRLAHNAERIELSVFIGARTKKYIVCDKDFRKLGAKVYIATDDGSRGYKGLVTKLLAKKIPSTVDNQPSTIYACGPKPMLKEVARLAKQHDMPCQVSLEEYMACGIGTCLGCAAKTITGYRMVCKDGPVFDAKEVVW